MPVEYSTLFDKFKVHELGDAEFGHRQHLQVAYEMLHKYGFLKALYLYATAISTIATNAGAPDKFNMTLTLAFLSLVAERAQAAHDFKTNKPDFESLLANNQDLFSSHILDGWYPPPRLHCKLAQKQFLMPTRTMPRWFDEHLY